MPLWLKEHGMTGNQIAWILAVPLLGRAITGPISGIWADGFRKYRTPIALLALISTLSYAAMTFAGLWPDFRFTTFMLLYGIGYTGITNITPLLDAMTLQLSRIEGFAFGVARAAGSASFVFANICLGYLMQSTGSGSALVWIILTSFLVFACARFLLPAHIRLDLKLSPAPQTLPGLQRLGTLFSGKGYVVLLIAVGCLQAAHSYYYAFSTIIWERRGFSSSVCGLLWATGVAAEFAFLCLRSRFQRQLGSWTLLVLGAIAGIVRWAIMMTSPPLEMLWPLQLLHAFSFGAVYVAGLELVHLLTPPGFEGLGQTINSAYAGGALIGVGTLASGMIFDAFGEQGYALMASLSLAGTACAVWLWITRRRLLAASPEKVVADH